MTLHSKRSRVTRREAAEILATSFANVRKLQRRGLLRSTTDMNGVHLFDREAVVALRRQRGIPLEPSGDTAAEVFEMIRAGRSFPEIVIETRLKPEQVRELWREYDEGRQYRPPNPVSDEEIAKRVALEAKLTREAVRGEGDHEQQLREMDKDLERRRLRRRSGQ